MVDKYLEIWYFERFSSICADFPCGDVIPFEKPDFIIYSQDNSIGIEITRYYIQVAQNERPRQEQESICSTIVNKAKEIFSSQDPRHLHVNVQFAISTEVHKHDIDRISNQLALSVYSVDLAKNYHEVLDINEPAEVDHVVIVSSPNLSSTYWFADDIAFTPKASLDELQSIISSKETKLMDYRL